MSQYKAVLFDLDGTLIVRLVAFRRGAETLYDEEPAIQAVISRQDFVELMLTWDHDGYGDRNTMCTHVLELWPGVGRMLEELMAFHKRVQPLHTTPDERIVAFLLELHDAGVVGHHHQWHPEPATEDSSVRVWRHHAVHGSFQRSGVRKARPTYLP